MHKLATVLIYLTLAIGLRAQSDYKEAYRPQFHFTPAKNWMNDPNGEI